MPLAENGIKRAFVHSLEEDLREIYVGYNVEIAAMNTTTISDN